MKCSISPYPTPLVAKYDSTPECHLHVLPSLAGNAPLDVIFSNTCDRFGTAGQKSRNLLFQKNVNILRHDAAVLHDCKIKCPSSLSRELT
ncbi:hypothetical protein AcV5_010039 [Taiwanofungus camphoratus]|nr:hypothetical protein AcV5_010039 [Antrodia cinnamomea]